MHRVKLYYNCSWADIGRIKQRFGITCGTTINGETCQPIEVSDDDWPLLLETQRRGYIKIRKEYEEDIADKEK
jgi:hypothetical protein